MWERAIPQGKIFGAAEKLFGKMWTALVIYCFPCLVPVASDFPIILAEDAETTCHTARTYRQSSTHFEAMPEWRQRPGSRKRHCARLDTGH
jgi:hypothetical protein